MPPLGPADDLPRVETSGLVPAEAVYVSWRLPARSAPEFDALDLLFGVLGHGQTSRLHKRLVREAELAESSSASCMGLIGGNSYGFAYARARDGVPLEELEVALLAEVDALLRDGPTEVELRRANAQYERHWLHELAAIDSRADALGEYATLLGDPHLINTRLADVSAVGMDAIAAAAAAWFGSDRRGTLIYRKDQP